MSQVGYFMLKCMFHTLISKPFHQLGWRRNLYFRPQTIDNNNLSLPTTSSSPNNGGYQDETSDRSDHLTVTPEVTTDINKFVDITYLCNASYPPVVYPEVTAILSISIHTHTHACMLTQLHALSISL